MDSATVRFLDFLFVDSHCWISWTIAWAAPPMVSIGDGVLPEHGLVTSTLSEATLLETD